MSQSLLLQRLRGHGLLVPSMKKATSESHGSRKRNRADDEDAHSYPSRFSVTNLSSHTSLLGSILDTDFQRLWLAY